MSPLTWFFLAVVALLVFFRLLLSAWPSPRNFWLVQRLPGPPGHFIIGNSLELAKIKYENLITWIMNQVKIYPRILRFWVMGAPTVILSHPDDVQVLLTSMDYIKKGLEYINVEPWLKEGLLTSTGAKWHHRRKLLTPTFHFRILEDSLSTISKNSLLFCDKLAATGGQPINIESLVNNCALDVICEAAMGISVNVSKGENPEYISTIKRVAKTIVLQTVTFWMHKPWIFNFSHIGRELYKNLSLLHKFSEKVINDRRKKFSLSTSSEEKNGKPKRVFLDALLEEEARNPGSLTTQDIREEVDTFMFEGHDTTTSALLFCLFNLGSYPDIQEKVYQEVEEVLGGVKEPSLKDLQSLSYLDKVIKETLRLYPSVPYISRLIEKDLVLADGVTIPSMTNVGVMILALHRKEEFFPEPERFDPERWSEAQSASRHPFSYIPFSAGPRNCIGQKFALLEMKLLLCQVVRRFRVEAVTEPEDITLYSALILKSLQPIVCKFTPR